MILKGIRSALSEEAKKRWYYLIYSIAFCCLACCCFSWFILSNRSLIWQMDGWSQHFKALVYYSKYLREILRHLIYDHRLVIPEWDFYIGEGGDILNALHYYVIGDPFALLSVLVPTKYMHYFYSFASILRLYVAGIAFSALCFGTGRTNRKAILAGALAYSLCYWGILNAARHPYFLNPMIWFPLLVLGIEKIIRDERPYLFIVMAAVSAASNFYFFYMIVLLAVGYAAVRLILLYGKDFRKMLSKLLCMGGMALLGVCISAVILLPVMSMFLNDSRLGVTQPFHLFYPLSYYSQLPAAVIEYRDPYWLCLGMSVPTVLCTFLLFVRRQKEALLKTLLILCCLITLFPVGGRVLNGMSYMTNRWCWAFVLLLIYIMVKEWELLFGLTGKEWRILLSLGSLYAVLIFVCKESRSPNAYSVLPLLFLGLLIVRPAEGRMRIRNRQAMMVLMVGAGLVLGAFWKFSPHGSDYAAECIPNRLVESGWTDHEAIVVKRFAEEEYPRYSGTLTQNVNMIEEISNTGYYFSISIPSVNEYRNDLNMRENLLQQYSGYDDRTSAIGLASVGYYIRNAGDDRFLPYGFDYIGTESAVRNVYDIYRNRYPLPLGYCYDTVITDEMWAAMDPVQRQEVQLTAALTDQLTDGISVFSGEMPDDSIPYTVECIGNEITPTAAGFTTTAPGAQIILHLDREVEAAELYLGMEGIRFVPTKQYDLYFGPDTVDPQKLYGLTEWDRLSKENQRDIREKKLFWDPVKNATFTIESSAGALKTIGYKQPDANHTSGRQNFIANLGIPEEPVTSVTITFPLRGIYTFSDIQIYAVPMDGYEEKIKSLQTDTLQNIKLDVNTVSGDVTVRENKVLCVVTPYSKGWKAYVDGEEKTLLCVNKHYLGVELPEGDHSVSFRYATPLKREGLMISLAGTAALAGLIVCLERKKKQKDKE